MHVLKTWHISIKTEFFIFFYLCVFFSKPEKLSYEVLNGHRRYSTPIIKQVMLQQQHNKNNRKRKYWGKCSLSSKFVKDPTAHITSKWKSLLIKAVTKTVTGHEKGNILTLPFSFIVVCRDDTYKYSTATCFRNVKKEEEKNGVWNLFCSNIGSVLWEKFVTRHSAHQSIPKHD